ncbi:SAVED domain-containing protein [Azorhizobium sp. AG788]|uniref:SAVED domain-containing protein n=1 Tax=Azorhizobium sp. AG788 TaxID=2183897 RepID=UPI003138C507
MKDRLGRLFDRWVEWRFRLRSVVLALISSGVGLLLAAQAGFVAKLVTGPKLGGFEFSVDTGSGTPAYVTNIATTVGAALVVVGLVSLIWQGCQEHSAAQRKRVLIIEARGLRSGPGRPLQEDVPKAVVGRRELRVLDFRQMYEADITDPELGLDEAHSLPGQIRQAASGTDRADFQLIYGGVAPVPYTFLTGVLVDDENGLTVMDWDRSGERWRLLDNADDGERFVISGTEELTHAAEVVIAISVSYRVQAANVRAAFPGRPVIWLTLENGSTSSHWSAEKQAALAKQFLDVLGLLEGMGARRINVILAAPNSLVFRFGRTYDRNHPPLIVWQYEREQAIAYPWGILMPPGGRGRASVVRSALMQAD